MLMPFLCLQNDGNSPQKTYLVTSIIFTLMFFLKKIIVISNIELKSFQINLILELLMCLRSISLKLILDFNSL